MIKLKCIYRFETLSSKDYLERLPPEINDAIEITMCYQISGVQSHNQPFTFVTPKNVFFFYKILSFLSFPINNYVVPSPCYRPKSTIQKQ